MNLCVDFRKKDMPDQLGGRPHGKRREYWATIMIKNNIIREIEASEGNLSGGRLKSELKHYPKPTLKSKKI
ncbi:hypothetical protein BEN30_16585 [Magnetovibrio blakemorei]|uniref:Uncharacterized protein n=1 Tax=Magnetovibrio blakemorei TaxID=28181 RepID=A0A1E5Q3U7_9PROT|nr:hypothetical protein BEN30_16585 [Magnetovibrio blakemorei]